MNYRDYLNSPEWSDRKDRHYKKHKNTRCRACGSVEHLDVHHKTYKRLGNESKTDLITMCRSCHSFLHDVFGAYKIYNISGIFCKLTRRLKGKIYDESIPRSVAMANKLLMCVKDSKEDVFKEKFKTLFPGGRLYEYYRHKMNVRSHG